MHAPWPNPNPPPVVSPDCYVCFFGTKIPRISHSVVQAALLEKNDHQSDRILSLEKKKKKKKKSAIQSDLPQSDAIGVILEQHRVPVQIPR